MSLPKTDLEQMGVKASVLPFNPTAAIQKTNVQEAIEQAIANAALSSETYLVKEASADLSAERVVTDTATIAVDWATTGQAKFGVVDDSITYAKMQNVDGLSVVGRSANSSGDPGAITGTDGQVLRVAGTTLGFGTIVAAGIASDAVITAKILDHNVTLAKLAQGTALSVLGITGNATADYADIVAGSDAHVLRRSGTAVGFGQVVAGGIASDAITTAKILDANVTYAKIANGTGLSVFGRSANSGGVNADIVGTDGQVLRVAGTALGFGQILNAGITDGTLTTVKLAASAFDTDGTLAANSDTRIASQKAVKTYIDALATLLSGALVFKGSWDASAGTFPGSGAAQTGWFYKVSVAGTVDGQLFTVGDDVYATVNNASATTYLNNWLHVEGSITSAEVIAALGTNSIALAKIAQGTALSVLGVTGGSTANYADIVAASDGHVMRRSGSAVGFGTIVAAGIASDAVITAKILDANVTYAKIANGTGLSVIGRSANSGGVNADIVGTDGQVLRVSGTSLGFGTIATAGIADAAVTLAKMANIATNSLIGRDSASSGVPESILLNATLEMDGSLNLQRAALSGAVVASAGSNTTTATGGFAFIIDGGGSAITTGIKGDVRIPFALTLTGWTLLADQSGAIKIDIWRDTLANYPPTNADSITNAHEPEITASGTNAEDTNISDWTDVTMDAGDILRFNVDSAATVTRATLVLYYTKTG